MKQRKKIGEKNLQDDKKYQKPWEKTKQMNQNDITAYNLKSENWRTDLLILDIGEKRKAGGRF